MLDPAAPTIDATATATGLRSGPLSLARFAGNIKLTGGVGEARASIAGARGRAFDIQTAVQIAADHYSAIAQGTVDRRPLRLVTPAVITRDGDGWRLAPTRLSFAGGEANVGGHFGGDRLSIDGGGHPDAARDSSTSASPASVSAAMRPAAFRSRKGPARRPAPPT